MGLDMYLNRKKYVKSWDEKAPPLDIHIKGIDPKKVIYITEECMYWRKQNAIHKWFVDNCQDGEDNCHEAYVERGKLEELYKVVGKVLKDKKGLVKELLPTTEGFFFGGTEYDEYYWEGLKETYAKLKEILNDPDQDWEYYYDSSW